jgi:hypothetical protein
MIETNERGISPTRDAASDLRRNTLSKIETVFGRLVYCSGLCDPNSGRYGHFGLAQIYGSLEADRALREAHRKTFSEWLSFTLREQWWDLEAYLSQLGGNQQAILREWERNGAYCFLVPANATDVERQLYLCDLEVILAGMRTALGAPAAASAA